MCSNGAAYKRACDKAQVTPHMARVTSHLPGGHVVAWGNVVTDRNLLDVFLEEVVCGRGHVLLPAESCQKLCTHVPYNSAGVTENQATRTSNTLLPHILSSTVLSHPCIPRTFALAPKIV
jgi:hypothetical protein